MANWTSTDNEYMKPSINCHFSHCTSSKSHFMLCTGLFFSFIALHCIALYPLEMLDDDDEHPEYNRLCFITCTGHFNDKLLAVILRISYHQCPMRCGLFFPSFKLLNLGFMLRKKKKKSRDKQQHYNRINVNAWNRHRQPISLNDSENAIIRLCGSHLQCRFNSSHCIDAPHETIWLFFYGS